MPVVSGSRCIVHVVENLLRRRDFWRGTCARNYVAFIAVLIFELVSNIDTRLNSVIDHEMTSARSVTSVSFTREITVLTNFNFIGARKKISSISKHVHTSETRKVSQKSPQNRKYHSTRIIYQGTRSVRAISIKLSKTTDLRLFSPLESVPSGKK